MEKESFACTAVVRSRGISSNPKMIRFQILAKDAPVPTETYKGVTSERLYLPLSLNYAKCFGFEKHGIHMLCDLSFEWDDDHDRYAITITNAEKVNLLQAKKAIRELTED